jgi:hypothetical protein
MAGAFISAAMRTPHRPRGMKMCKTKLTWMQLRSSGRIARAISVLAAILFATPPLGRTMALAQTLQQALQAQKADALPLTSFYDTPVPLPPGRPGSLINSEPFEEYQVPPGVGAVLILYHSRSASGQDVASSGVVLVPFGTPPAGGWPVIAWAHGTSGIARMCAPSLMKDVYYSWEDLFEFPCSDMP